MLSGLPDSDSSSKSGAIGSWEGGFLTCIDAERCRCGLALQEPKVDALSMAQTIPLRSEEVQADCMRRFSIAGVPERRPERAPGTATAPSSSHSSELALREAVRAAVASPPPYLQHNASPWCRLGCASNKSASLVGMPQRWAKPWRKPSPAWAEATGL